MCTGWVSLCVPHGPLDELFAAAATEIDLTGVGQSAGDREDLLLGILDITELSRRRRLKVVFQHFGRTRRHVLEDLLAQRFGRASKRQQELVGTAEYGSIYPEWRAWLQFGLVGDAWSADLMARWIDKTVDRWKTKAVTADPTVESMLYWDLVGTYEWDMFRFTAGVNNILDEDPPYWHGAFNANTEPGTYDVIGRRFFTSVSVEF